MAPLFKHPPGLALSEVEGLPPIRVAEPGPPVGANNNQTLFAIIINSYDGEGIVPCSDGMRGLSFPPIAVSPSPGNVEGYSN